ncbi:MAG: hypothetical protein K8S87_00605, partial [Planctomycetes bacterium]|nr:hypothetical protein [Planctomycetota bacterium]
MKIGIKYLSLILVVLFIGIGFGQDNNSVKDESARDETQTKPKNLINEVLLPSCILSEKQLLTLFDNITHEMVDKLENYEQFIELINTEIGECWYFGRKDLHNIDFPKLDGTPQKQLFDALRMQIVNVCKIHEVFCIVDSGIYFHAETREDLIELRARICKNESVYEWASNQFTEKYQEHKTIIKIDYDDFVNDLVRGSTSEELDLLRSTSQKENKVLKNRLECLNIVHHLYPEPNYDDILDGLPNGLIKSDFELLNEINKISINESEIDKALKSDSKTTKKAGELLRDLLKLSNGKSDIVLSGKLWWALLVKYSKEPIKLKSIIETCKPGELSDKALGGIYSAVLFTQNAFNSKNEELAEYFLDFLKYFDNSKGTADLITFALKSQSENVKLLIPMMAKLDISEAAPILFKLAKKGSLAAFIALSELKFCDTLANDVLS